MSIRVAIVGVGNCASSLVQGIQYYTDNPEAPGLISQRIGDYDVSDIEIVATFDIIKGKVGVPLHQALLATPNDTYQFAKVTNNIPVLRGPTLDGLGQYLSTVVEEDESAPVNVAEELRRAGAEIVVNYLPVGSECAALFYAESAIAAGCAFINCMPVFIASDPIRAKIFVDANLPIIGDDVKSQVGASIVHRVLAQLMRDRGVKLLRTSQLNVGGNSDFLNMLERNRLVSKKISKTQAVTSIAGVEFHPGDIHIGPSDHVPFLTDRKWAYIRLEGEGLGKTPINIELKLEVWDSPNSAGVILDTIRCARIALDRGEAGAIIAPSAFHMKSPPVQFDDDVALTNLQDWIGV